MNRTTLLLTCAMITIGLSLSAQNSDVEPMPLNPGKGAPYERIEKTFPASAVSYYRIDPRLVKNTGILSKQKSGEETFFPDSLQAIRALKLKNKQKVEALMQAKQMAKNADEIAPKTKVEINPGMTITPPDNTLAISDSGYIVAADNARIGFYDESGNELNAFTYPDFLSTFDEGIRLNTADPKVVYDPENRRFVFFIQSGSTWEESFIILGFSTSEDPRQAWNFYSYNTHREGQYWFDYPSLAVNNNEVFISGNLFNNERRFQGNCVYQLEKDAGYEGIRPTGILWQDIKPNWHWSPIGGVYAVPSATRKHYGPGIYLIACSAMGGGDAFLFEITNRHNKSPEMRKYTININDYSPAVSAAQPNTRERLDVGDCRIKGAFYLRDRITFVFSKSNPLSFSGIAVTRINVTNFHVRQRFFHNNGKSDYCYPSIAHRTQSTRNYGTIMVFQNSGTNVFPQIRKQSMRGRTLTKIASSRSIQTGNTARLDGNNLPNRWGDYITIQRKFGAPVAWMVGHTANDRNQWRSHLIKIDLQ